MYEIFIALKRGFDKIEKNEFFCCLRQSYLNKKNTRKNTRKVCETMSKIR